jgi:hypothetical protein
LPLGHALAGRGVEDLEAEGGHRGGVKLGVGVALGANVGDLLGGGDALGGDGQRDHGVGLLDHGVGVVEEIAEFVADGEGVGEGLALALPVGSENKSVGVLEHESPRES